MADLDRLRHARKRMSNRFPLSPDLWIDWLEDEINLATLLSEKEQVILLFQTAVKDYLCKKFFLHWITLNIFDKGNW